jgi:hypothetical protein
MIMNISELRQRQDRAGMRDYRALARLTTDQLTENGVVSEDALQNFVLLLNEKTIYSDDALYDLLANIWTLPEAFSPKQVEAIINTILEATYDDITDGNCYVIADIIVKTSDDKRLANRLATLRLKKNTQRIIDFIESTKSIPSQKSGTK